MEKILGFLKSITKRSTTNTQNRLVLSLQNMFAAQGLVGLVQGDKLLFPDQEIGVIATTKVIKEHRGQIILSFNFRISRQTNLITERFIAFGRTELEAIDKGFELFGLNVFPVILSAFFSQPVDNVKIANIELSGTHFRIHQSRTTFVTFDDPQHQRFPAPIFSTAVEKTIEGMQLTATLHWISAALIDNSGEQTFEFLLDNTSYPEGLDNLTKANFPPAKGSYKLSTFAILIPKS